MVIWRKNLQDGLAVGERGEVRRDWVDGGTVYRDANTAGNQVWGKLGISILDMLNLRWL